MRPRGEVRSAIAEATQQLAQQQVLPTWRDLVAMVPGISSTSPADLRLVRKTVENMALAGELERAGNRHVQGVARPMTTYRPRSNSWVHGTAQLDGVVRGWRTA
jgi:hypothetical protein